MSWASVSKQRLNTTDEPKTWKDDCAELIDSGVDVLIVTPRNVNEVGDIYEYAQKKNVKVISYARAVLGGKADLLVGCWMPSSRRTIKLPVLAPRRSKSLALPIRLLSPAWMPSLKWLNTL